MQRSDCPFLVSRTPDIDAFLTHYFVMRWYDEDIALGEAGNVRCLKKLGPGVLKAYVVEWLRDPATGAVDENVFHGNLNWRFVCGPRFVLVPKGDFRGVKLKDSAAWSRPIDPDHAKRLGVPYEDGDTDGFPLQLLLASASLTGTDISELLPPLR